MINVKNKFINNLKTNIMKIFTLILLLCAVVVANAADPVTKTFNKTGKAPVIDGIVDDSDPWSDDAWMDLAFTKASSSTTDASSKMQMLFSKDIAAAAGYIYLVITIKIKKWHKKNPRITGTLKFIFL